MSVVEVSNVMDVQTTIHIKEGISAQLTVRVNNLEMMVDQPISLLTNAISEATESINNEMIRLATPAGSFHFGLNQLNE